jgi:hypothetical protein
MHRSVRRLLCLAAVSAAVVSATVVSDTIPSALASDGDEGSLGPVHSRSYDGARARAVGHWELDEEHGDVLTVNARLYDRNSPSRLCAYLEVTFEFAEDEKTYTAMKCGPNGFASFKRVTSSPEIPSTLSTRVCYWDRKTAAKKYCGKRIYLYGEADEK